MAITDPQAFTRDDGNWTKTAFLVALGQSFESYLDVIKHSMQSEEHGANGQPGLSQPIAAMLNGAPGPDSPVPVYFSRRKCRDTSLGGNDAINCLPSYCENDDIIHPFTQTNHGLSGMGRVYSEVIDDAQQIMYLTFGIPEFNSVSSFYRDSVVPQLADLMNKGDASNLGYLLGSTVTTFITLPALPLLYLNRVLGGLDKTKITKYYDFSNKMALYYRCVNSIIVHLAVNMGLANDNLLQSSSGGGAGGGTGSKVKDQTHLAIDRAASADGNGGSSGLPEIFEKYGFDIYRIMCKKYWYMDGITPDKIQSTDQALKEMAGAQTVTNTTTQSASAAASAASSAAGGGVAGVAAGAAAAAKNYTEKMFRSFSGTLYDAQMFVGFRIEKSVDSSESLANQTGESEIAQTLNSKSQAARNFSFSMMNGNIGDGAVSNTVESIFGAIGGMAKGVADTLGISGVTSVLTGSGVIDIPEVWTGSSFSKSYSFTIKLRAPYGHPVSIMQSIYVPLALLLGGALPRAVGPAAYTSPFLCRAYCKGMFAVPLGIIDSMTITRGSDQHGWTYKRLPTAVDVSFTIKDLSPAMYLAVAGTGGILSDLANAFDNVFGQNSSFQEYLMTLSGMGLPERISYLKNVRRRTQIMLGILYNTKMNPLYYGYELGQTWPARAISAIMPTTKLPENVDTGAVGVFSVSR